ncbi:MAG: hypothetical protein K0S25_1158 [Bacillus sp. (in: firmicutes)]|jgi:hypothetical protein|nr:hypothetical protein [Bacillus sp. (in: firmicutes)]
MAQPRSYRVFYLRRNGRIPLNVNLDGFNITNRSTVLITAGQFPSGGGFFDPNVRLGVHGPDVFVTNICPHGPEGGAGGVEFMLHINSNTPINVAVTITVLDPFEGYLVV